MHRRCNSADHFIDNPHNNQSEYNYIFITYIISSGACTLLLRITPHITLYPNVMQLWSLLPTGAVHCTYSTRLSSSLKSRKHWAYGHMPGTENSAGCVQFSVSRVGKWHSRDLCDSGDAMRGESRLVPHNTAFVLTMLSNFHFPTYNNALTVRHYSASSWHLILLQ